MSGNFKTKTHKQLWSTFRDNTTIHGFPHVKNAVGVCKSLFWLLVSMTASGFLVYHLYRNFSSYFAYKTSAKLSILQQYQTEFPTVTLCNLNPIKKSSLDIDPTLQSLLLNDAGEDKKKLRRKREADLECVLGSGVKFTKYGICYDWWSSFDTRQLFAQHHCKNTFDGGLYQPFNQDIVNFIASSGILDSSPFDDYWVYYRYQKWGNVIPVTWTNFNSAFRDDGVATAYAKISDNNLWHSGKDSEKRGVLCQKVVECPHPVYTDGSGETFCWFVPLQNTVATWTLAKEYCSIFSYNAISLFEPKTEEAMNFFLSSNLYSSIPNDAKYWIGIYKGAWQSTEENVIWTNWDTYGEVENTAYIDKSLGTHEWHSAGDNQLGEQAMVICQVTGLLYNGYIESATTSTDPTTPYATSEEFLTTEKLEPSTAAESTTKQSTLKSSSEAAIEVSSESTMELTTDHKPTTETEKTSVDLTTSYLITNLYTSEPTPTTKAYNTTVDLTTSELTPKYNTSQPTETTGVNADESTKVDHNITASDGPSSTTSSAATVIRKPLSEEFVLEQRVVEHLASVPDSQKAEMGYQSYEFIVDCQFEGWKCHDNMLFRYFNPVYGNCYLFNSGWDSAFPVEVIQRTGRMYGLKMILNIGEDDYLPMVSGPSGARVVVHPQSTMPHPESEGSLAEPGKLISIGVKRVVISRKGYPYGNCTEEAKHQNIDVYAETYPVEYNKQNCFRTCYQRHVIERCGCADSTVPRSGSALGIEGEARVCDINNTEEDDCKYLVNLQYTNGELGCSNQCPDPCFEEYFVSSSSTAAWPSTLQSDSILEKIKDKIPLIYNSTDIEKYKRNLLLVEVFYEDFNYEEIEEIETYKTAQFVSDIGGILGLWVGCSVISLFELLELGMDCFALACKKLFCTRKVKPSMKSDRQTHKPKHVFVKPLVYKP